MEFKQRSSIVFLLCVLLVPQNIYAQYGHGDFSIEISATAASMEFGTPLILEMDVRLNKPFDPGRMGNGRVYKLDGLRLVLQNQQTGEKSRAFYLMPVKFFRQDEEGLEYSTSEVVLWDLHKKRGSLVADLVFAQPGAYLLSLERSGRSVSNTIKVVVEPSEVGTRAMSLLTDANDLAFLVGGVYRSPKAEAKLATVVDDFEATLVAKWAAARLGVEYFKDFHKKHPSFEKFKALLEQNDIKEPLFESARKYLALGAKLPDGFAIRAGVLSNLASTEYVRGDYEEAVRLLEELAEKYPNTEDGRKAVRWKEELVTQLKESPKPKREEVTLLPAVIVPIGVIVAAVSGAGVLLLLRKKASAKTK